MSAWDQPLVPVRGDWTRKGEHVYVSPSSYNPLAGDLCSEGHEITTAERRPQCVACHNRRNGYTPAATRGTR